MMEASETVERKRGRPFGKVYREGPYFHEKVDKIREMYDQKMTFQEMAEALEMTRAGTWYLFKRWVEPTLPKQK